jgi:D-glycerate 3-kinase
MSSTAHTTWAPLADELATRIAADARRPLRVAIAGAQGSGKTTLARILTQQLQHHRLRAVTCSLDDFYLTRAQRQELAQHEHPLLATRGVPGTHDVGLCLRVLDSLPQRATAVPVFDKSLDDRSDAQHWPVAGPVDVVVIEGWCLGARPEPAARLLAPVNELERDEDADGRWRRFVNASLAGQYQDLFASFDLLVYLQVPDFAAVRRWRGEQELQIPPARRMSEAGLRRFTAHYERLTRWMIDDVPARADVTVRLDADHRIATSVTKSRG